MHAIAHPYVWHGGADANMHGIHVFWLFCKTDKLVGNIDKLVEMKEICAARDEGKCNTL